MEGHARTWFTPKQKAELWERWKSGQCVADIARALERRNKSGVYRVLAGNRIALRLNQRPRKTLGFETPADRLRAVLQ
jgi:IS30 family transposase